MSTDRPEEPSEADPLDRALAPPASLFEHYRETLASTRSLGPLVDLASGRGRNAIPAAETLGPVVALDRNRRFLDELGKRSHTAGVRVERVQTDLETPFGIPLKTGSAGSILVFRYLHRPLAKAIESLLAPGGWLLYETFTLAQAQRATGPSRPEFLLRPDELRCLFPGLEIVHYKETSPSEPSCEDNEDATAQLVARKPR